MVFYSEILESNIPACHERKKVNGYNKRMTCEKNLCVYKNQCSFYQQEVLVVVAHNDLEKIFDQEE